MRDVLLRTRVAAVVAAATTALPSAVLAGVGPVPAALALLACLLGAVAPRSPAGLLGPALLVVVLATGAAADVPVPLAAVLVVAGTATLWSTHVLLTALAAAGAPDAPVLGLGRSVVRRLWPPLVAVPPAAALAAALQGWSTGVVDAGWPAAALLVVLALVVVLLVRERRAGTDRR